MESSSPSVQYQHFQLSKLHRIDVEKNATRNRRREDCAKVAADVEPGLAFCGELSYSAEFKCIQSPGDTQSTQSARDRISQHNVQGNQPLEVQIKMTQRQVLKCGKQMQR